MTAPRTVTVCASCGRRECWEGRELCPQGDTSDGIVVEAAPKRRWLTRANVVAGIGAVLVGVALGWAIKAQIELTLAALRTEDCVEGGNGCIVVEDQE